MSTAVLPKLMTAEEFLALPQDGMDRWLIQGQLRAKPMTYRNRFHSNAESRIAQLIGEWVDAQPVPPGDVFSGEAGFRFPGDPATIVGIDVAYVSAEVLSQQTKKSSIITGIPTLAVEILSPSDKLEEIEEKVEDYLRVGVPLIWVVNTRFHTVTVHRPDTPPELFNENQELLADPHLPGFRVAVAKLFSRKRS